MTAPAFLVTIDTEGDNQWARPREITTRNVALLPRFHELCRRHGVLPTYLTNYEMATDPAFVAFGRAVLAESSGEIGMHLHAWNSPPLMPLTSDDLAAHPPLVAYPSAVLRAKVAFMTRLLEDTFEVAMESHRAGRWAFDGTYARALVEQGYRADCSVTPHMAWRYEGMGPGRTMVVDHRRAPHEPYRVDLDDVTRPGGSPLLEVPLTVRRSDPQTLRALRDLLPAGSLAARGMAKMVAPHRWLRPRRGNLASLMALLDETAQSGLPHAQFIIHSSELMPGGSPYFPGPDDVEQLFDDLDALFAHARSRYRGMTVGGFARAWQAGEARRAAPLARLEA
ncbi:polysaccharide deacetylase family protein [Marinimicrococcus flavescens]|uniref:Deacetylase n=1 Tax=Marinimicrococcus flavescens TaxID=3031815 RepID=A0AAP3XPX8_9PROT|nr:hypothetical protein [Marinimicrococcus flavescens]